MFGAIIRMDSWETVPTSTINIRNCYLLSQGRLSVLQQGALHSLALTKNGAAYSWGNNQYGQLGDDTLVSKNCPKLIKDFPVKL